MTLYDIQGEYLRLYDLATDIEDPDSDEAFNNALDELHTDLAVKAEGYAQVIKQLDMEADECDKLIEIIKAKKEARKNHSKRMKEALMAAMDVAGISTLPAGMFTLRISKNGGKQPLKVEEDKVPDRYMKLIYEVDNEAIRKVLEGGIPLDFAHLEERGRHLSIK